MAKLLKNTPKSKSKKLIQSCEICKEVWRTDTEEHHKRDCKNNTKTAAQWEAENNRRTENVLKALIEQFQIGEQLKYIDLVSKMSNKELGDYLIEEFVGALELGTMKMAVMDEVILRLQGEK